MDLYILRWELFPFSIIKLCMISGFWLLMYLNQTFLESKPVFFGEKHLELQQVAFIPPGPAALVCCCSLQLYLPSDPSAEKSYTCCKRNYSIFSSWSCLLCCFAFCFLHFLSNFSWPYTILLQNVVNPGCSASMWHK